MAEKPADHSARHANAGVLADYPKSFYPHLDGNAEAQIARFANHLMTFAVVRARDECGEDGE